MKKCVASIKYLSISAIMIGLHGCGGGGSAPSNSPPNAVQPPQSGDNSGTPANTGSESPNILTEQHAFTQYQASTDIEGAGLVSSNGALVTLSDCNPATDGGIQCHAISTIESNGSSKKFTLSTTISQIYRQIDGSLGYMGINGSVGIIGTDFVASEKAMLPSINSPTDAATSFFVDRMGRYWRTSAHGEFASLTINDSNGDLLVSRTIPSSLAEASTTHANYGLTEGPDGRVWALLGGYRADNGQTRFEIVRFNEDGGVNSSVDLTKAGAITCNRGLIRAFSDYVLVQCLKQYSEGQFATSWLKIGTDGVAGSTAVWGEVNILPSMAKAPDGSLWFLGDHGSVYKLSAAGVVTKVLEHHLTVAYPSIEAGPDGRMWIMSHTEHNRSPQLLAIEP